MANASLAVVKKEVIDSVEAKIAEYQSENAIHFPPNYSPQNALKSAWLVLQETKDKDKNPVLEVCSRESIANALLNTVIQGLNPAKRQVYYIAYGKQLVAMRSYHGTLAVTKRVRGVEDVYHEVIYQGDEFELENNRGAKRIMKHVQRFENIDDSKIIGAYCVVIYDGGKEFCEVMTMEQIKKSWSKTTNGGGVQKEFPAEMARRTVINRCCKRFINASDDSDLLIHAFNSTDGSAAAQGEADTEIKANANTEFIEIAPEPAELPDIPEPGPAPEPAPFSGTTHVANKPSSAPF